MNGVESYAYHRDIVTRIVNCHSAKASDGFMP